MQKHSASHAPPSFSNLTTHRALRDRSCLFPIEGVRSFVLASDRGFAFREIIYSERLLINPVARKLVRHHRRAGVRTRKISPEDFRTLSKAKRASGIAAVLQQNWMPLTHAKPQDGHFWLLVERVNAPGNLGTLLRSSHAFGGAGVMCVGTSVDPFSPDVIRASMGAFFAQRFVRTDWDALSAWVESHGCSIIGATPDGPTGLHVVRNTMAPVILLGEERKGLTSVQRAVCHDHVRIPMLPGTDSLNLGVAGSLVMYEIFRNRA